MGLLQKACETYDAMADRVGIVHEGEEEPLAPVSHVTTRADIKITLDQDGNFVAAQAVDGKEPKMIMPVTEKSIGRTSKAASERPHPLCDNIKYLLPYKKVEYNSFISQLSDWANSKHSTPKLRAILRYVQKGTILTDLSEAKIIQLNQHGQPTKEDLMVCWEVNGLGENNGPCWTDLTLMRSFVNYYAENKEPIASNLCMVSGQVEPLAEQHIKGIVSKHGNAKLISSNDKNGYTYRGRFDNAAQAATVSYNSSQKAHNALRWLVANQGVRFGERTFLCWNPQGIKVPEVTGPMGRKSGGTQRAAKPTQYRQQLRQTLSGWKVQFSPKDGVVIAAFDAATAGRLAITYYNELLASDFLDRLYVWDDTCKWENFSYGIQSPSLYQIISWAFGIFRNGKMEIDDRIKGQHMQRLVTCRVDQVPFPLDIERALVEKASHLLLYEGENRQKLLFTACAAIRKYHYDHLKEEWDMALDKNCADRSYLFGRLLAIADAVENSTYTGEDRRETNALRMQKAFSLRPMATWRLLEEKLEPYYKQLSPGLRQYYRRLTQEITDKLSPSDRNLNQKLDDIYLLGYYHQRAYRTEKADKTESEE